MAKAMEKWLQYGGAATNLVEGPKKRTRESVLERSGGKEEKE